MDILQTQKVVYDHLVEYGLFDQGWRFKLTRAHKILGNCNYTAKLIGVSRYHIQYGTDAEILDTIKHEIAHALVGVGHGHGPIFQAMAIMLGATPGSKKQVTKSSPHQWKIICGRCGLVVAKRYRCMSRHKLNTRLHSSCGLRSKGKLFFRQVAVAV